MLGVKIYIENPFNVTSILKKKKTVHHSLTSFCKQTATLAYYATKVTTVVEPLLEAKRFI